MMRSRAEGHVDLLAFSCEESRSVPARRRGTMKVTKVLSSLVLYVTDDFTEERLIARGMKVATIISR